MEILGLTGSLGTGIGLLLGLALLKYSGYVAAVRKELSYIAAGAVFLLLAGVAESGLIQTEGFTTAISYINLIFVVVAFLLTLIGALLMAVQIFSKIR
jgi:hypothetical protein